MYLYFLPISRSSSNSTPGPETLQTQREALIPTPTPDGGIEHTSAQFLSPSEWLSIYHTQKIILFPPQFLLLHLVSQYLSPKSKVDLTNHEELTQRRYDLLDFTKKGNPPWTEKCISPSYLYGPSKHTDMLTVMDLSNPGSELQGSGRGGEVDMVLLVDVTGKQPRHLRTARRDNVVPHERKLGPKV